MVNEELRDRLRREIAEGERSNAERREARLVGEGVPEWERPPTRVPPSQRASHAGAGDMVLRDAVRAEVERQAQGIRNAAKAEVEQLVRAELGKFAESIGIAFGKMREELRSEFHAEIRAAEKRATESSAASSAPVRRVA